MKLHGLREWSFDQGPLGHSKRKPTTIGTNIPKYRRLEKCRGPGMGGQDACGLIHSDVQGMGSMGSGLG